MTTRPCLVHRDHLPVIVRVAKKLQLLRAHLRRLQELRFDLFPLAEGIDEHVVSGGAGDVEIHPIFLINESSIRNGNLDPPLSIDFGGEVTSEHNASLASFNPKDPNRP